RPTGSVSSRRNIDLYGANPAPSAQGMGKCQNLGLTTRGLRRVTLAGGEHLVARVTEPVEIH
ncbi:MAG: hypothetical protein LBF95_05960, partial [Treponema sp.]|nr:hypothetical protein [Treponema sp.]